MDTGILPIRDIVPESASDLIPFQLLQSRKYCLRFRMTTLFSDSTQIKKKSAQNLKKCRKCYIWGGLVGQNVTFLKLCLKSSSSQSESFREKKIWVTNGGLPQYFVIFDQFWALIQTLLRPTKSVTCTKTFQIGTKMFKSSKIK